MKYSVFDAELEPVLGFLKRPGDYAIEIGCYEGNTTRRLALATGKRILAIDPWDNSQDSSDELTYQTFLRNTHDLKNLTVLRTTSGKAVLPDDLPGNCCLVFVDGDHSYHAVLNDLRKYWPFLSKGGVIALHDAFKSGHADVLLAIGTFARELPRPTTVRHIHHFPTHDVAERHQYDSAGVSYIEKV